jgi:hypothetical protein
VSEPILDAAQIYETFIAPRLPEGVLAGARSRYGQLTNADTGQKGAKADATTLREAKHGQLTALMALVARARRTAKLAFKAHPGIMKNEFLVGVGKSSSVAAKVEYALIVAAACKKAPNLAALTAKGWTAADNAALDKAIAEASAGDNSHKNAQIKSVAVTDARTLAANALYDDLMAIQNAANLEWPAENPANAEIRALFRLGTFPPPVPNGHVPEAEPAPKAAATAAAAEAIPPAQTPAPPVVPTT